MKPQGAHSHEDRLLDFAYGELPPSEAQQMEQHVQGCSRCLEVLDGIRGVRTTMSRLTLESAPDAGLESLLAYAQQSARRSAAGPELAPRWWRRLLAPALGLAAMSTFGVVVFQVNRQVDLSPPLQKGLAQEQAPRNAPPMPAAPTAAPVPAEIGKRHAQTDEEFRDEQRKPVRRSVSEDWANAGSGGGFPAKKGAPPPSDDEYVRGPGFGSSGSSKESLKFKRGVSTGNSRTSLSTAQRSEPGAPMAEMESKALHDDDVRQVPESAQVASAAPPPPPAPALAPAREQPPAASADSSAKMESLALKKKAEPAELEKQAQVAYREGNREQEAEFLRAALSAGAQGAQRLDVLSRLCEAEFALGRRQNAINICKQVVMEAPGTSEARQAQRLLDEELLPSAAPMNR